MKYSRSSRAFTLVEILLAITVLAILLVTVVGILEATQRTWRQTRSRIAEYRDARLAFDLISRNLGQATLNSYWDYYYDPKNGGVFPNNRAPGTAPALPPLPDAFQRMSELRFVSGPATAFLKAPVSPASLVTGTHCVFFQAANGSISTLGAVTLQGASPAFPTSNQYTFLNNLLCARGYFIMFGDDSADRPPFITPALVPLRYRFRLMEYRPPAEQNLIYTSTVQLSQSDYSWFNDAANGAITSGNTRMVADNIIAMIISPRSASSVTAAKPTDIAPIYLYNSASANNISATPATASLSASKLSQGTQHLLPPVINITLVALDEASAIKLAAKNDPGNTGVVPAEITTAMSGLFTTPTNAATDDQYNLDLSTLTTRLAGYNLNYRVFSTSVPMREWKN